MATGLGIITILGLIANYIFTKLKLPGLLGMLLLGIMIGPYGMDLLSPDLMRVSSDFREIALIVILLRAGLGLDWDELKKVGKPAIKLSFIPGVIEGIAIMLVSKRLMGLSLVEGGILGFIIAAVSPAVVVPSMLHFKENSIGTKKGIPTMILAGASLDDIVMITIFTGFLGLYGGKNINLFSQFIRIPVSIITGVSLGIIVGFIFVRIFERYHIRDTKKVLMITGAALLIMAAEDMLANTIPIAGLLSVMTIGFIILLKRGVVAKRLSVKFNKIWILAEILLFVLVGAQVNIHVALDGGAVAFLVLFIGLLARSLGVFLSLAGTNLNQKERIFCAVAYTPKATVQAAIGAVPLAAGVASGELILAIAVLSIILTAPLGAIGIRLLSPLIKDRK